MKQGKRGLCVRGYGRNVKCLLLHRVIVKGGSTRGQMDIVATGKDQVTHM